jgi:hypothetical protein
MEQEQHVNAITTDDHWVYVLYAPQTRRIKIGRSKTEHGCEDRLRSCQTGSPEPLHLIGIFKPGTHPGEKAIHSELAAARVHGEWFSCERHTIYELEDIVGRHRLAWPTLISNPIKIAPPDYTIERGSVCVDREPFEVDIRGKIGDHTRSGYLYTSYAIEYEALSDDYDAGEHDPFYPYDKWRDWARSYALRNPHKPGIPIYWSICGCGTDADHPNAYDHFRDISNGDNHWNKFFHKPTRRDHKPFLFADLPMHVKRWHPDFAQHKGGFIEEFTGFRPSYLQPWVTLAQIEGGKG